ncbi:hypothetical protein ACKI2C_48645, partial [Streptomyces brasiliscabiei]
SSTTSTNANDKVSSPQQAMALAEAKYGDGNGDWTWTYLTDGTDNPSSFFVKAISKSQIANGSMTGTAKSVTVYRDGSMSEN